MVPVRHFKAKVCLVGDAAVGKTSLVRRFVLNWFDDHYLTTIGTKVTKKELEFPLPDEGGPVRIDLAIWDIMGQPRIRELLADAYFTGAQGILAVVDVTRRMSLENLGRWIDSVWRIAGVQPVVLAVNKTDLEDQVQFRREDVEAVARSIKAEYLYTSARTGANVEEAFQRLGRRIVDARIEPSVLAAA